MARSEHAARTYPLAGRRRGIIRQRNGYMGFDTYLKIDDAVVLDWRKQASPLPRLLFQHDQVTVRSSVDDDGIEFTEVTFSATAAEALANLDDAGLGWHAAVAAYSEFRLTGGYSSGMFIASLMFSGPRDSSLMFSDFREREAEKQRTEAFERLAPEIDLTNLSEAMARQWIDPDSEQVVLLSDLSYNGDLPEPLDAAMNALKAAEAAEVAEPFAAARAAESLAFLDRSAPLLAWPLVMCVFLKHLPPDTRLVLNLSEDARESYGVEDETSAREYAASYWERASESLTGEAQALGRLFAVLASFNSKLGRDFWFARAADLLGRITTFSLDDTETSARSRGDALESLVDALVRTEEPELRIVEKNFRTAAEEIDLLLSNSLSDPFWIALGSPLILVECKNWTAKVGVSELRIFESKITDRGALCKVGIFVSMSGFTKPFLERLQSFQSTGGVIFAIDGSELHTLVTSKVRLTSWLRNEGIRHSLGGAKSDNPRPRRSERSG